MGQSSFSTEGEKLQKALFCMQSVLQLLDETNAPADIGAHVDMAKCRLTEYLADSERARSMREIPARRV